MSNLAETILLRRARPQEHDQLEELQANASRELPEFGDELVVGPEPVHLTLTQIANGQVIVAEFRGDVAGFAAVAGGELDGVFVEPRLWGRGIGRKLINAATNDARGEGLALSVIANPSALPFYETCGFVLEATEHTRFGPRFRMTK